MDLSTPFPTVNICLSLLAASSESRYHPCFIYCLHAEDKERNRSPSIETAYLSSKQLSVQSWSFVLLHYVRG